MANIEYISFRDTHRLVTIEHSNPVESSLATRVQNVLDRLASVTDVLATSEEGKNANINRELVSGVPEYSIINAAFVYTSREGKRFNDARRGAWYAGIELKTSQDEVSFHKLRSFADTDYNGAARFQYRGFHADFAGEYHHLSSKEQARCLKKSPVPECYGPGQNLANQLLYTGSNGIVYPSVRNPGGTCIVCFRPALVYNVRRSAKCELSISSGSVRWVQQ
jgi:RES domain